MTEIDISAEFGPWKLNEAGHVAYNWVEFGDAQALLNTPGPTSVIVRLKMIVNRAHADAIKAGTEEPVVVQFRMMTGAARPFAALLETACDRSEGRAATLSG